MATVFDFTKPLFAYYSVPAAWCLALAPTLLRPQAGKNFDHSQPRRIAANVEKDTSLDKKITRRIQRAEAASINGLESLGFYAAGVVAALTAGVPPLSVNLNCAWYLASRVLYNIVFIFLQDNRKFSSLRSLVWGIGAGFIAALWVKAGNKSCA